MDGILPINKAQGFTSHDVVAIVRKKTGIRRVGHSGTLDPMATGVLPIFIGKATRLIEYATDASDPAAKAYLCRARFGIETDTQDIWGKTLAASNAPMPSEEQIAEALQGFVGEFLQTPPSYSAVKIGGKKLYELAREGKAPGEGAVKERRALVKSIGLLEYDANLKEIAFSVECGKGVYIRTICADLGKKLGCGAAMSALTRTKSDGFFLEDCISLEQIEALQEGESLPENLIRPMDTVLSRLPKIELSESDALRFVSGQAIYMPENVRGETAAVYHEGDLLGIGKLQDRLLRPKKIVIEFLD